MSFFKDFIVFLKNYQVIGLAVAFVIGSAATKLVTAFVNDILMPILGVFLPGGDWQQAVWQVGPVKFLIGDFIAVSINFVIIAVAIFFIVKLVIREDPTLKR